jgi:phosphoribosylformylglycinamidine synthase
MKAAVITFPGSNCDLDLVHCLRSFPGVSVAQVFHKETDLQGADAVFLPGGFSYGDYLRCGAIAKFSPVMGAVRQHAERGGLVLGICNGFQILVESGLLPGVLRLNVGGKFICDNVHIRPANALAPIAKGLDATRAYKIPIAHAEGNYYCDPETLRQLQANRQVMFQYCTPSGEVTPDANPNGALLNIAGISNPAGNVMGMMPHPERAYNELLGNTDGRLLMQSLLHHCLSRVAAAA